MNENIIQNLKNWSTTTSSVALFAMIYVAGGARVAWSRFRHGSGFMDWGDTTDHQDVWRDLAIFQLAIIFITFLSWWMNGENHWTTTLPFAVAQPIFAGYLGWVLWRNGSIQKWLSKLSHVFGVRNEALFVSLCLVWVIPVEVIVGLLNLLSITISG